MNPTGSLIAQNALHNLNAQNVAAHNGHGMLNIRAQNSHPNIIPNGNMIQNTIPMILYVNGNLNRIQNQTNMFNNTMVLQNQHFSQPLIPYPSSPFFIAPQSNVQQGPTQRMKSVIKRVQKRSTRK